MVTWSLIYSSIFRNDSHDANENKAAVATIGNAILLIFNIGNFIIISKD